METRELPYELLMRWNADGNTNRTKPLGAIEGAHYIKRLRFVDKVKDPETGEMVDKIVGIPTGHEADVAEDVPPEFVKQFLSEHYEGFDIAKKAFEKNMEESKSRIEALEQELAQTKAQLNETKLMLRTANDTIDLHKEQLENVRGVAAKLAESFREAHQDVLAAASMQVRPPEPMKES